MTISRRVFLKSGGVALFSLGLDPLFLARAARASDRPVLVCVFLRGAVDGLSMIVPHGEPLYYRERPRIAIPARDVVDLDGHCGLHPGLAPLQGLWDNKSLAAIHAVGSPDVMRSHLDAQERMDGWLRRSGAVAFGSLHDIARRIKAGAGPEVAVTRLGGWDTHLNQGSSDGRLAARLRELGLGLAAFARDLGDRMRSVVVLTMSEFGRTIGENGNGGTDHGHATAMLVLGGPVNGGKVLGRWPGGGLDPASRFEARGVPVTTDVRDLFSEILVRHLGAGDLAAVFPGFSPSPQRFPGAIRS
jgi:uncharacterized protein (DUF1501 family)